MAPRAHPRSERKEPPNFSPKITRQRAKRKEQEGFSETPQSDGRSNKASSLPKGFLTSNETAPAGPMTIEDLLLRDLPAKQRNSLSSDFKEKMSKVGSALIALYSSKKELQDTDTKLLHLEETYGKTMKIQDLWNYHERAGLSAIIGQDPQYAMNAPHVFNDEERLMYNSSFPRPKAKEKDATPEPEPSVSPPRPRTRAASHQALQSARSPKRERLSTDDED
ncbi:hypothetical protein RvY_12704 [Ramazzottius varieornatus]|uniref:Uncharacterized protein n=1 Tax=Ramazzottius varieornatus TaxID=947166 RepID=A0A1D1VU41_RAMVA|nr:hypothetical protein RvY_12704 [Ramazzottius varieornatus]